MKRLLAALVVVAALIAVGGASADGLRVGVADDWPKFHPCGDVFWQSSKDIGLQDLRVTVQWGGPGTAIPYPANIQQAVDCALLEGVRPILAIYPARPSLIGSDPGSQAAFAMFVAQVAQSYPRVQNFIVGNEPNVNRFWQPQYTGGQDAAGKDYEHTLAQAYDALKLVRPDGIVWGPAISSRGNDNANATSNPSHSPVWFIKDLGDAYRASGRTKPIFDEFNMHPYPPVQDTDPFTKPFLWPQAGAANVDRIKQALWDAFHGTGQPVPAEQPGGRTTQSVRFGNAGLPINLDEVGEQTDVMSGPHASAYTSPPENVQPISEQQQAQAYTDLMGIAACDPDVKSLLFFPLIDEAQVSSGFQSGELDADFAHKASYDAIKSAIATTHGQCRSAMTAWAHTTSVVGAQPFFGGAGTSAGSQPKAHDALSHYWAISFTASEDTTWKLGLYRLNSPAAKPGGNAALSAQGSAHAYFKPLAALPANGVQPGWYAYKLQLAAAVNPSRTVTFTSNAFAVGVAAAPAKHAKKTKSANNGKANNGKNAKQGKPPKPPKPTHKGKK